MGLNLELNYVVDAEDRKNPNFKTDAFITIWLLRSSINATKAGKEGHKTRGEVRIAARVVNKITNAKNKDSTAIEFDQLEILHVRDLLKAWLDAGVPEPLAPWYEALTSEVERLTEAGEKAIESAAKNGAMKVPAESEKVS